MCPFYVSVPSAGFYRMWMSLKSEREGIHLNYSYMFLRWEQDDYIAKYKSFQGGSQPLRGFVSVSS
jgi:hypothetical protein